jgi:hypothetical protein
MHGIESRNPYMVVNDSCLIADGPNSLSRSTVVPARAIRSREAVAAWGTSRCAGGVRTASVMAVDLATKARTGVVAQLCGDPTELDRRTLFEYAQLCGEALAKGHARTSDSARPGPNSGSGHHLVVREAES